MAKRIKENIRFYLPNDPYFAEVDNLPIRDLLDNDIRMQDQIDELAAKLGTTEGRDKFNELRPYVNAVEPGKVFVTPGTFMARQTLPATREGGLSEQLKSGAATFNVNTRQDAKNSLNRAAGIGRMSPVRLKKNSEGADQSISIEQGSLDDFYSDATPPKFRVDLVYAKGNPGMDTDFGNAELGVVKGAFFLNGGGTSDRDGILLPRFAGDSEVTDDEVDLTIARILSQRVEDVQTLRDTGFVRDKIDPETGNVLYTSIPCPDVVNLQNSISEFLVPSGISQTDLSEFADFALRGRNYFALPIAYVFVPFTYVEGTAIPAENILDIRPFFSTPELTLYERQAILGSYRPGLRNRFLTLTDPKITDIDSINTTQDSTLQDILARLSILENAGPTGDNLQFLTAALSVGKMTRTWTSQTPGTWLTIGPEEYGHNQGAPYPKAVMFDVAGSVAGPDNNNIGLRVDVNTSPTNSGTLREVLRMSGAGGGLERAANSFFAEPDQTTGEIYFQVTVGTSRSDTQTILKSIAFLFSNDD